MLQNETPPVICKLDGPSIIIQDTKRGVFLYNPSIRLVSGVQSRDNPDAIVVMVPDKLLRHFFNMDITEIISMLLEKLDNTSPGHYVLHPDGLRSVEEKGAWEFEIPQGAQLSCSL